MATRTRIVFSDHDRHVLATARYAPPDPRVQRRLEVLWLLSQGETQARVAELAGVARATVERYVVLFRQQGVSGLREFHWVKPTRVLEQHRPSLEAEFHARPPHTVTAACERSATCTGVRRGETQVRKFLRKGLA